MGDESGRKVKMEIPVCVEHMDEDVNFFIHATNIMRHRLMHMVEEIKDPDNFIEFEKEESKHE
jgi:hypothetical protein